MHMFRAQAGLPFHVETAQQAPSSILEEITDEAAITPAHGEELRIELVAREDAIVRQGQPVARLRSDPSIAFVAPMAGRIASVQFNPGHRLVQMVFFNEPSGARQKFAAEGAADNPARLRALMQGSGLWRQMRSRPFGHMPKADEVAAGIFVMAVDSRPGAPDPRLAIEGREEDFRRGLVALAGLGESPVFLCATPGYMPGEDEAVVTRLECSTLHPMGMAGMHVHRYFPAAPDAPVWSIHAEDVADLGALLATGYLPGKRLISITGNALRSPQLVRCQSGADLRGLSQARVKPGPHDVLSGSALDGRAAHWLGPLDRQASILRHSARKSRRHWFQTALERASRPRPVIPTAALAQALGGTIPAMALVRALGTGDTEKAVALGVLSLLEEDLAAADYVTAANPPLTRQLRTLLDRIEIEEAT